MRTLSALGGASNAHGAGETARLSGLGLLGTPLPGFGDPRAEILIIGLAPAAHGGNRTGRMFTGDRSGDFLYRAIYEAGFASQPTSTDIHDGLILTNVYISAAVRCAPPDNKPLPEEFRTCRAWLEKEIAVMPRVRVVIALGRLAFESYLALLHRQGKIGRRAAYSFGHNQSHGTGPGQPVVLCSYHPSQQNTQTGRLTPPMLRDVFESAKSFLEAPI